MTATTHDTIRSSVREHYGKVAQGDPQASCAPGCCGANPLNSRALGYTDEELSAVPDGANLGLGCGNPQAIAALRLGETVLDLGSGAGFDSFLAAKQVGASGKVIGVDMTPAMISKARSNAERIAAHNVDFRLGEIEHLPVADATVDVILSNCVINLSPDKKSVFTEAFRVLRPGGRLAISDVVALAEIPEQIRSQLDAISTCVAGAATVDAVKSMLVNAGFEKVQVQPKPESREFIRTWMPDSHAEDFVCSATIEAVKPGGSASCCTPSCCSPGVST